jgi:ectoine hydroxylase-related dioxygenase (phytanoyl-CoA dioxygenase family)
MLGFFLQPTAADQIRAMDIDPLVKHHAIDVIENGYTVVRGAVSRSRCDQVIDQFKRFAALNDDKFSINRLDNGHFPRISNLHMAFNELLPLFTQNHVWLAVQDILFGGPTSLYTSLFYEIGSQQPLHRDTPVFSTRPEYLYFGTTVYLEAAGDENGCLEVLKGGHRIPQLDREDMARRRYGNLDNIPNLDNDAWMEYQDTTVALGRAMGMTTEKVYVEAGDSLIWHPQLPHGGTAICDMTRTRYSLVMHTTPVGVPVYHQNVFFNPNRPYPETAAWEYLDYDGRKVVDCAGISFNHANDYPVSDFRRLNEATPL